MSHPNVGYCPLCGSGLHAFEVGLLPPIGFCAYCQHPRSLHSGDGPCSAEAKLYEGPPTSYDPEPSAIVGPCACASFVPSVPNPEEAL